MQRKELTDVQREKEREKERLTDAAAQPQTQRRDRTVEFSVRVADLSFSRSLFPFWIESDRRSTASIAISPSRRLWLQHCVAWSRLRLRRAISPFVEPSRLSLFLLLLIWPDLMIFFSGFCLCFCIEEWMILYICFATEKMWITSRKCVFYGIFKNKTKH